MAKTPSAEALEAECFEWLCRKYVQRSDARQRAMCLQYTEAETHDLAAEIAKYLLPALDRFAAARVEAERERCFWWAIGRIPRSQAIRAIRAGDDPHGTERDAALCWRCGMKLHPGHSCGDQP